MDLLNNKRKSEQAKKIDEAEKKIDPKTVLEQLAAVEGLK